jgi:hypothetical protein
MFMTKGIAAKYEQFQSAEEQWNGKNHAVHASAQLILKKKD